MITLQNVTKSYGPVPVIGGVSLQVEAGQFVSLLGPSGCGKTTLLRCIAGLETISGGEVRIAGKLVSSATVNIPPEERNIGFIFQSYALWPHMTVRNNVAYSLKLHKMPAAQINERVAEALALVGLKGLEQRYPAQLSGGQQQRVALARSVAARPQVLLFDEPLSNLDAALRERMRGELRELQQRLGITAVYVTHDQSEALAISDHIVLMRDGHMVQQGSPAELYSRPQTAYAASFLGNVNFLPGRLIARSGGLAQVALAGDVAVACRLPDSVPNGAQVLLGIRPEEIEVSTSAPFAENNLMADVQRSTYLGAQVHLELALPGLPLRASVPARDLLGSNPERVNLRLPVDRLLHIPEDDLGVMTQSLAS